MDNIIKRIFRNLGRALGDGTYVPPAHAGRLLADGTFLDLNKLTVEELRAYQRMSAVPERFGKPASEKQVERYMRHKAKKAFEALPTDRRARFEALHGDVEKFAWENPDRWRAYLQTGQCCADHPPAPEAPNRDEPGPSFPGYGTRY